MRPATTVSLWALTGALLAGCTSHAASNVRDREHQWTAAMRAHDLGTLDDILAEEFRLSFVDFPGALPREQWLANLENMTFGPIEMDRLRVSMQGENVATVRMRMTLHDWYWGEDPIPAEYDLTDVWVRRDGRWQVINRISEPLEPMGPPPAAE